MPLPVFSAPGLPHQGCDKATDAATDLPPLKSDDQLCLAGGCSYTVRVGENGSQQRPKHKPHCNPLLMKDSPSPRPSPVYVKGSPFYQKTRKTTSYRPVYRFDNEDSDSESDGDLDCDQVAAFLVDFLDDDEDDFDD